MASTSVNLTKIKRGKGTVYQIDYRINRKRIREVVGPDRRTAELKRATTQQALIEGKLGLNKTHRRVSSLKNLTNAFLAIKKREVSKSTAARYSNYLNPLVNFLETDFVVQQTTKGTGERVLREFNQSTLDDVGPWTGAG